jgi:hypothetical protein
VRLAGNLNDTDRGYLEMAVELSRGRAWTAWYSPRRSLTEVWEGDDLRKSAVAILRDWARQGSGEPSRLRD